MGHIAGHEATLHDETWQGALRSWLDGRILCEEARRYVGNFLSVHRVRPQDDMDSDIANSDDLGI